MPPTPHALSGAAAQQSPVIVVGAGLAGLCASHAALRAGAPAVRLLERAARPGGNSIKASSGINGAPTRWQAKQQQQQRQQQQQGQKKKGVGEGQGEKDTYFFADTIRSAGSRLSAAPAAARADREALIARLTGSSAAAVEFLADDVGVDLSVVARLGGHSFARTHRGAGKTPPGAAIVLAMLERLRDDPRFELMTGCEVTRLLLLRLPPPEEVGSIAGETAVTGVEFTVNTTTTPAEPGTDGDGGSVSGPRTLSGPVVFATGGFAGDTHGLLAAHRPDLTGLPSTNDARPGAHGLLASAGARLVDMDAVQIHPTGFVDPAAPGAPVKFLAAEMLRGVGGVLLRGGRRFVDEMQTREVVSRAVMEGPLAMGDGDAGTAAALRQWDVRLVLDPGACEAAGAHVGFYLFKGLMEKKRVGDLDETTRETLRGYAKVVRGEMDDEFGRTTFGHWTLGTNGEEEGVDSQEVCIGRVTPITHFTMGGAAINEKAQVLASNFGQSSGQKPIPGLWAAGEITGGIHGDNRLGGSSLLECVVYGLIAGEEAAKSLSRN